MLSFPEIDPVLLSLGPLKIHWYGLMYLLGYGASYLLVRRQIRAFRLDRLAPCFDNLNFALLLGLILGGRLGYVLFYNPLYYLHHPLEIIATWQGGMSFHGGLLGVVISGVIFCRRHNLNIAATADCYTATVPIGLGLGRVGNFINGELYGRVSDVPWAMVFPEGGPAGRHPSQLYEAGLEGVLLFAILWPLRKMQIRNNWADGRIFALFLLLYGLFRFLVENYREPDQHIGLWAGWLSRGQILSCLMIGAALILLARKSEKTTDPI